MGMRNFALEAERGWARPAGTGAWAWAKGSGTGPTACQDRIATSTPVRVTLRTHALMARREVTLRMCSLRVPKALIIVYERAW